MTVKTFVHTSCQSMKGSPVGHYVEELLDKLERSDHYVEVRVFPTRSAMRSALAGELEGSSIKGRMVIPDFPTFHEAFSGYPRIWISYQDLDLSKPICRARLQHEVGHAVLHWEISSYLLRLPPSLDNLVRSGKMSSEKASLMSYLISISVKDFEVSDLLNRYGIGKDQVVFYLQELSLGCEKVGNILDALNELKVILGAYPFRFDMRITQSLDEAIRNLGNFQNFARDVLRDLEDGTVLELEERMECVSSRIASIIR